MLRALVARAAAAAPTAALLPRAALVAVARGVDAALDELRWRLAGAPPLQLALDVAPSPEGALRRAVDVDENVDDGDGGDDRAAPRGGFVGQVMRQRLADLEALGSSIWLATPKRKTSYSKKRMRQMNPLYASPSAQNFYPCPKCDKGLLKLRHHLCPCDQGKVNAKSVVKVKYGTPPPAGAPESPAPAAGAASTAAAPDVLGR